METAPEKEELQATVTAAFPELRRARFAVLGEGWDCLALEADGRLVFKFPRSALAEASLRQEAALLAVVRPAVSLPVPETTFHPGPPAFSCHVKIPGEQLLTRHYEALAGEARQRLAADLARFFAELHALDPAVPERAGAHPIMPWQPPEAILRRAIPLLPTGLRRRCERAVEDWAALPPDPCGTTFGFFDGHGWNMAFDHRRGRLNGLYDFGDAGFGPLHQEFLYPGFVARDLTERIVEGYEVLTGRRLDRWRIALLVGVHRLSELAELADDPRQLPVVVQAVADWAAGRWGYPET